MLHVKIPKISDKYLLWKHRYRSLKNSILYSDYYIFINVRLTISVTAIKPGVRQNDFGISLKNRSSLVSC